MKIVERTVGALAVLFGLLGLAATSMARGMQTSTPVLDGAAWTRPVRAAADWVIYVAFIAAGSSLILRHWTVLTWVLVALLAGGRMVFDLMTTDVSTSRGETILYGDRIGLAAAVLGLSVALVLWRARSRAPGRT